MPSDMKHRKTALAAAAVVALTGVANAAEKCKIARVTDSCSDSDNYNFYKRCIENETYHDTVTCKPSYDDESTFYKLTVDSSQIDAFKTAWDDSLERQKCTQTSEDGTYCTQYETISYADQTIDTCRSMVLTPTNAELDPIVIPMGCVNDLDAFLGNGQVNPSLKAAEADISNQVMNTYTSMSSVPACQSTSKDDIPDGQDLNKANKDWMWWSGVSFSRNSNDQVTSASGEVWRDDDGKTFAMKGSYVCCTGNECNRFDNLTAGSAASVTLSAAAVVAVLASVLIA